MSSEFCSFLADEMREFVELKHAVGYSYVTGEQTLLRIDRFLMETYPASGYLSQEIAFRWCEKRPYEKETTRALRASIIRQFAAYLESTGTKAYVLPKNLFPCRNQYVPYIFSADELKRFFAEACKCQRNMQAPLRHLIMPVYFKLIYSCGLRPQEARLLWRQDVDLDGGVLHIRKSKNDKDRLVPVSPSMLEQVRDYAEKSFVLSDSKWFFPSSEDMPMSKACAYRNFRTFLWRACISHSGSGPRIYDFRHAFACHRLREWAVDGKDLMAYFPVLQAYMGHDTFRGTAYYLKLTADAFPDITLKLENKYADIVPALEESAL